MNGLNRRAFLSLAPAGIATLAFAPGAAWAQTSPVAKPALPVTYADVASLYDAASERALSEGRAIAAQIFGGELQQTYPRLSPQLQGVVDIATLESQLQALTSNRVSFAADSIGLFFDGRLDGDTIEGFVASDAVYSFSMTRGAAVDGSPVPVSSPLADGSFAGDWSGQLVLGAGDPAELTVSLTEQSGTLSLPVLEITDAPLSGIAFDAERPIGELIVDWGGPLDRTTVRYWARYAWGDRALGLTLAVDDDDVIQVMQIAPEAQLPPDPAAGYVSPVSYQLPFEGLWWVYWGGDHPLANYHAIDQRQRHAVDLLIWNDGATYRTDGAVNTDYWVYGQPVLAPADGVVIEVQDDIAENTPRSSLPNVHPGGNHIGIQTAPEEFVVLAHLQPGSITVANGDTVTAGQVLGLAGNSGNSSEPHLHIHLQNEPDFFSSTSIGLPLVVSAVAVDGRPAETATLEQGSFVSPA